MTARTFVNLLSLSRIPLALLLIIFFQPDTTLLQVAFGIWALTFLTDVLDGHLARKFKVASLHGRLWDSLGDKSFYIAVIVAFGTHGILGPIVCWGLLVREVALYITRIWYIEKLDKIEQTRAFTNWHGYLMYITIGLGFANMYQLIDSGVYEFYVYNKISAYAALGFGIGSILQFLYIK